MVDTTPMVWAKDKDGYRHLCSVDILKNPNFVDEKTISYCIDHYDRIESRAFVPSNDPQGKIRFAKSLSLN
ncbi:MAG: hypothetical protein AB9866_03070 [Syntrophobacteraceae bacterium]